MPILAVLTLAVMVFALIDAITRRDDQVKHLPKFAWVFFIVLLPLIGSILWFTIGREWEQRGQPMSFGDPRRWQKDAEPAPAPRAREVRTTEPAPAPRAREVRTTEPAPAPRAREVRTTEQQIADLEREIYVADLEEQVRRRRAGGDAPA